MKHFDTLKYKEELEKSGMSEKSARALTKMNTEFFEEMLSNQNLATKTDIDQLDQKIENVKSELIYKIESVKGDIQSVKRDVTETLLARLNLYLALMGSFIAIGTAIISLLNHFWK